MSKNTLSIAAIGVVGLGCVSWVVRKIRGSLKNRAPMGYEDEDGFHFGAPMQHK
jgi:hypothetical protein